MTAWWTASLTAFPVTLVGVGGTDTRAACCRPSRISLLMTGNSAEGLQATLVPLDTMDLSKLRRYL